MRFLRLCIVFALCACAVSAFAQKEDWLPITPQDLSVNSVPGNPGAPAIQLYYSHMINDEQLAEDGGYAFYYRRIKILNDKGLRYADVEIPIFPGESLSSLKARTIHPDGKIIDFTGKPFEKTLIKGRGLKIQAKTFTLPEVTAGSIVEFRWKIDHGNYLEADEWIVQHDLYTVKEVFRLRAFQGRMNTSALSDEPAQSSLTYSHLPPNVKPRLKGSAYEMEAENVPAFEPEEYMPPEDTLRPQVRFFYGGKDILSPDVFWSRIGQRLNGETEAFIGKSSSEVRDAAAQAVGGETDPEKKLRKLYARAQEIRNLTYERRRTQEEQKKESLKGNNNAGDVLKRGFGDRNDITRLFVAMVRASGMEASVAEVSNRANRMFDRGFLSNRALDSELAVVPVNGKEVYFDPGTPFCPYGQVRWIRTSTAALRTNKDGGSFVLTPASNYDQAVTVRTADMTFGMDGGVKGEITIQYKGLNALELRLDALDTDEAGRKKQLEGELKDGLTTGAVVNLTSSKGWDKSDEPLVAVFSVEIPGYATVAGKRILLPTTFFRVKKMEAFRHADRKFPVYFPYAFSEQDSITIQFPAGLTPESVPQRQEAALPYARYLNASQFANGQLVTRRNLLMNGMYFDLPKYPEIKNFFNTVQSTDEQQVIMRGGGPNAEKGN